MFNKRGMANNKRGQVTIFIIVAILIVVVGALIYVLSPGLRSTLGPDSKNPYDFIKTCLEEDLEEIVEIISLQGGSMNPEHFFLYNDVNIEYLCYTPENYHACVLQKIAVEEDIEEEIKNQISPIVTFCFDEMDQSYSDQGYSISIRPGEITVNLLPKKIVTSLDYEVTLSKEDSNRYNEFEIILDNNLYELIKIGKYIVEWEISFGGIDPLEIMGKYNFLDIDKFEMGDGTVVYSLKDKKTGGIFQLATRSYVFPPGI